MHPNELDVRPANFAWQGQAMETLPKLGVDRLDLGEIVVQGTGLLDDLWRLTGALGRGQFAVAENISRDVIHRWPGQASAHLSRAHAILGQGRYVEGWPLLHQALKLGVENGTYLPVASMNPEDGEEMDTRPLKGARVLVLPSVGLAGFGDQIQFVRVAKWLEARGADPVVMTIPPLVRLFSESGFNTVPLGATVKACSCWTYSTGALAVLRPSIGQVGGDPYLFAPPETSSARIGVVGFGSVSHSHDWARSLPPELTAELLSLPGAISLKPEDTGAADFYETARIIAGLDLVISVDTSVAHLAGAMGKPVWVLLSGEWTDWRWMTGRTDSPWYPSAKIYRQSTPGDWRDVIDAVKRDAIAVLGQSAPYVA